MTNNKSPSLSEIIELLGANLRNREQFLDKVYDVFDHPQISEIDCVCNKINAFVGCTACAIEKLKEELTDSDSHN